MIHVAIAGDGQLARGVARRLAPRQDVRLTGPVPRARLDDALLSGADVVLIATTTRLADVAEDIRTAVDHRSNVIASAEEAAYPWSIDPHLAEDLDALARDRGVTIVGGGLNPGFIFDALVLTLLGAAGPASAIAVTRTVDLSGFGPAVAERLGLGFTEAEFRERVADGRVLGHAGFPQSIAVVAAAIGRSIDQFDTELIPVIDEAGTTVGIDQVYRAIDSAGRAWFTARFIGRAGLDAHGLTSGDVIRFERPHLEAFECTLSPGIGSQVGSQAMISSSVDRVVAARPGWLTVADLPPAFPIGLSEETP